MHRNENKYDQLFHDRLRDISHPVRNELWSRIHSGIRARKPSVPRQPLRKLWRTLAQKLPLLRSAVPSNVLSVAAALAITFGIIHVTHTATRPSAQPVNHYSTIKPASKPAQSPGESSVTPRDSSSPDRLSEPATLKNTPATDVPDDPGTAVKSPKAIPESRFTTRRHRHTSADAYAHGMSAATPGKQTMEELSIHPALAQQLHRNGNPVALPALARTSTRAPIAAGDPRSKSQHNNPGKWAALPPFHRTGSVSFYASPDFPNHYYTWSYTLGFRATFQFSRRWSFTAGFEYARVNVPSQTVPFNAELQAFHFSNYEVPILFGYTRASKHSALTVYGGAIFNLYFHASTSAYIDNWPDRDSYGAVLGVEYSYSLGRHLDIFAQPYARYSISDYRMFTQTQRWSFGTLLGIKYRL
jgi:hypothetical protein